ncbi:unnamed protein product [Gadus morhua 'NCC']
MKLQQDMGGGEAELSVMALIGPGRAFCCPQVQAPVSHYHTAIQGTPLYHPCSVAPTVTTITGSPPRAQGPPKLKRVLHGVEGLPSGVSGVYLPCDPFDAHTD